MDKVEKIVGGFGLGVLGFIIVLVVVNNMMIQAGEQESQSHQKMPAMNLYINVNNI